MDLNDLRSIVTVASFVFFIAIWVWAYARRNQAGFDEASRLPLCDDEPAAPVALSGGNSDE